MAIGLRGRNLIFLISQPRAGSTLLQRILGGHPLIHTVSEPWLMLHPVYALRPAGHQAEYGASRGWRATHNFIQGLSGGEDEYIEGLRRMCSHLYERARVASGKRCFLDKTPRYYHIVPDLYRVFPEANFVFLLRNPLAVLCSMLNTWVKDHWRSRLSLDWLKNDLLLAPSLLMAGARLVGRSGITVHFETLLRNPEAELKNICQAVQVEHLPELVEYGRAERPAFSLGDKGTVYEQRRPAQQYIERWQLSLTRPFTWRLAQDYLRFLGADFVNSMGYSYAELSEALEAHRPSVVRLWFTLPLEWSLEKSMEQRTGRELSRAWIADRVSRLMDYLYHGGLRQTAAAIARKLVSRLYKGAFG